MTIKYFDPDYAVFRRISKGEKVVTYKRGSGYYLVPGQSKKGDKEIWELQNNGKSLVVELVDFKTQDNLILEAGYMILGYEGEKPVTEMSWKEFKEFMGSKRSISKSGK